MKEMIPLSLRQRKAFVWWARREYEDYAAIICDGAIRSGKTLAMGMGFFFWAMACFSDRQFALCGRSVGALRRNLLETVLPQLQKGLSALVYTQLTDVEDEVNGLFTYDRTAIKPDANAVRSVNAALAAEFARVTNPAKK